MYIEELLIIIVIAVGIVGYRSYKGQNFGKFITVQVQQMYDRFAPYSFKVVRVDKNNKCMEIEYSSANRPTVVIGARMPYVGESLDAIVSMLSLSVPNTKVSIPNLFNIVTAPLANISEL